MSPRLAGPLLALLAFGLYACHDAVVKILGARYAPPQILFFSVLFSFPLATMLMMREKQASTLRPVHPWWVALRTAAAVMAALCGFYAFTVLPLAQAYALIFAAPLLVTVFSIPVLGEKVGRHRWAAVIVGLIGVLVVLRPGSADLGPGHLAALGAAFAASLVSVISRRIGREERPVVMMLYPMMVNLLVMATLLPGLYRPAPFGDMVLFACVALLGFAGGLITIAAYTRADAAVVAPMHYSQIIWAAGFGTFLFNEPTDRNTWIGASIVIASGLYVVLRESRGSSENTPVTSGRTRPELPGTPRIANAILARANRVPPGHVALANRDRTH
ncbi:DMT family transporter [Palleronia caenipelagi]|uniref:DMT family transporter n=1 Tax=Palleronia caenipelagi TaxID=2489174 RepID=A0A547Q6U1_9RHOB|nr:DMT family transporter [Palleronia caenipelagi]TRD22073.1 DMT family transporter [Palleronia caenipelagi]